MSDEQPNTDLVTMTAEVVAAYVANNALGTSEVGGLIGSVYASLATLGQVSEQPMAEKPKPVGATTARKSLSNPAHILSMIDGKPYRMLLRHLKTNGFTAASYREAFGLPRDYPMVAPDYAAKRRELAVKIGLGRKPNADSAPADTPAPVRRGRKPKGDTTAQETKAPARRGRKPKALADAIGAAKGHLGSE